MTVSAEESRVGTTFGKYTITGVLGKGGMGEVYEAHASEIGRTVALKIIKSQFADDRKYRIRFERESHAAAKLQEPHVIPIHGYGEIDGCLFIDMRLVRGTDQQSIIDTAPLEPSRAVAIIAQIAAALDAPHAEGLIHRDVKPQNIIVTPADFAYVVDFGIAEVIGDTRLTAAGTQVGFFAYMAAVPCDTVPGAICDPRNTANFLMRCAGDGSNPWIKCTGGKDAVVYLW
jgi:serine/threonine protein kinase